MKLNELRDAWNARHRTFRSKIRRTVLKPLTKGSGIIAGFMVTRGNHWIADELPQ